ncbi:MAG TPA: DMT family transporter [Nocardioidaceae bacterium]|nr:DMT family transporter [Nocardioidaceae bacterium]
MGPAALALVLTAAVAHACWNFASKRVEADRVVFVALYVVASMALWVPVGVIWVLARGERPQWSWLAAAAVSAALHVVYNLVLQHGYAAGDLNLVYPLARGIGPLITFVVAVTLLGESPGLLGAAGAVTVVAGVLVMTLGPTRRSVPAGAAWGVATGLVIAVYTLWDRHAVVDLAVPPLPYFCIGLVLQAIPLSLAAAAPSARRTQMGALLTTYRWEVLAVAVLSPLSYVLVLQAMRLAPVALVAPARETSIVVGSLLGWWLLREAAGVRRLAGAAAVVAGIVLIATG